MKSLLTVAIVSLFFAACASKTKTEAEIKAAAPAQTTVTEKVETVVEKTTKKGKKTVEKVQKTIETTTTAAKDAGEVVCKGGADERKLAVTPKDKGCELIYTKAGQSSAIASQQIGNEKCEAVLTSVKEKLIASGFSCQ